MTNKKTGKSARLIYFTQCNKVSKPPYHHIPLYPNLSQISHPPLFIYLIILQPEDVFIPNCVREVALAIKTWEPRAVLEQVTFAGNAPHIAMTLHWRVADAVAGEVYRTDILLKAV